MSFVYFIECREANAVKVGWSKNVRLRLEQLQCGCPFPLYLIDTLPCERLMESVIHRAIGQRISGGGLEWFSADAAKSFLAECRSIGMAGAIKASMDAGASIQNETRIATENALEAAERMGLSRKSRPHDLLNFLRSAGPEAGTEIFQHIGQTLVAMGRAA